MGVCLRGKGRFGAVENSRFFKLQMNQKKQNNCRRPAAAKWLGLSWLPLVLCLAGCATQSTIQSRIHERDAAYAALPPDTQKMVDEGRIQVGMDTNAVYIAWGKPNQVLESGDQRGVSTTWIYRGAFLEETRYWVGWRYPRLEHDYQPRTYVRAEIVFFNDKVQSWRTLPEPSN
jgi:hypothetical protein